ncbi:MAG: hypothetical protein JZU59_18840, partial [Chromatium okenii]|nr:hypothetical protein [Chromatium okenii]
MQDSDKKEFSDAMDAVGASYGTDMSTAVKKLWWRLLADKIEFLALQTALDRHMLDPDRGRFMPKPADIIAIVEKAHHRLSADEAWAIALESFDESAT